MEERILKEEVASMIFGIFESIWLISMFTILKEFIRESMNITYSLGDMDSLCII